jgi:putative transposase
VHERRPHRLSHDAYAIEGSAWHVTICAHKDLGSPFADPTVGLRIVNSLESGIRYRGSIPHLICVMPDHVHLLIEVRSLNLVDLIARIKSESTQVWWRCGGKGKLWQKNFHDHGIRESEDFEAIATYILQNPVRKELVERWEDYPLICGAFIEVG